jgi:transcriptional regulator of heat shock response
MDERSATILLQAVETYILTGRPAGSSLVQRRSRLPVSTATIRTVLHELDATGYLHQPHTSAGRVPTDQGYRFYVDQPGSAAQPSAVRRGLLAAYQRAARRHAQRAGALAHAIAAQTRAYVIAGRAPHGEMAHTGISHLITDDTQEHLAALRELSAYIDQAAELIERLAATHASGTHVYIGQENPFLPAAHTSLVVRTATTPMGQTYVLAIMGPKRMPYRHYVRILDEAAQLI